MSWPRVCGTCCAVMQPKAMPAAAAPPAPRSHASPHPLSCPSAPSLTAGVLGESRAAGQPLPTYHRNETLQSGPAAGGGEQEGLMEMEEGGAKDEHAVSGGVVRVAG